MHVVQLRRQGNGKRLAWLSVARPPRHSVIPHTSHWVLIDVVVVIYNAKNDVDDVLMIYPSKELP